MTSRLQRKRRGSRTESPHEQSCRIHTFAKSTVYAIAFLLCLVGSELILPHARAQTCADYKIVSPLTEQTQQFSNWCTAAAVRVATTRYGKGFDQCDLIGATVRETCCPFNTHTPGSHPECHPKGIWPGDMLDTGLVNFSYTTLFYLIANPTGPPTWTTIMTEICNDRPMVSVASLPSLVTPNWHSVVVEGFKTEVEAGGELHKVRIFDPQEDLCEKSCKSEDQNPRFLTEDAFYNSLYEHDKDYIAILPKQ